MHAHIPVVLPNKARVIRGFKNLLCLQYEKNNNQSVTLCNEGIGNSMMPLCFNLFFNALEGKKFLSRASVLL